MVLDLEPGALCEPLTDRRWRRADVAREVAARARRYARLGLRPGERVFLHFGNRLEFFAELLALWRVGACAVPLDARLTAFEAETLARAAGPRFAVVDDATDPAVAGAAAASGAAVLLTSEVDDGDEAAPAATT